MSNDIMRYGGRYPQPEGRVPQCNLLLGLMSIPTSEISQACDWAGYDLIVVQAMWYSNVVATIAVPVDYFASTTSTARVIIVDPVNSQRFEVRQNGDGYAYVKGAQAADSRYGIRVFGLLLGE